ncbi:MAG: fasciclin domain-containing protein [bacterium]|nr:fasciclin domain-containing protein [bacterium]
MFRSLRLGQALIAAVLLVLFGLNVPPSSAQSLGQFQLTAPANNTVLNDLSTFTVIQWTESANAQQYTFGLDRIGTNSHILNVTLNAADICANGVCTIQVTDEIRALLIDGDYRWRVRAQTGEERLNASNNPFNFSVRSLGAFNLIAPADDAVVTDPTAVTAIQWSRSANAAQYRFVLDRGTPAVNVLDLTLNAADICNGDTCTIPVSAEVQALLTNGDYSWTVTAINGQAQRGAANNPYTFTVQVNNLGAFNLIAPADDAVVTDPAAVTVIQWSASANALNYRFLLVRTENGVDVPVIDQTIPGTSICNGDTCTIPVNDAARALLTNGDYRWTVTASNTTGERGASNNPFTFTVNVPTPGFTCRVVAPSQVQAGQNFTATLECSGIPAPGAFGLQVCLAVSGTPVTAQGQAFTAGSIFGNRSTLPLVNSLTNAGGCYGLTLSDAGASAQGSGQIATASFATAQPGTVNLTLNNVLFGDSQGNALPAPQIVPAAVQVVAQPQNASLNGSIERQAGSASDITVRVGDINGQVNAQGQTATFVFNNNLEIGEVVVEGDAPGHLACESTVALEAGENTLPGTITLIAGDADDDGDVDIADSTLIGLAFGTDGEGDNTVDLNGDGAVNVLDLIFIGLNFDRTGVQPCVTELSTIVEIAVSDNRLETLVAAVTAADLVETLNGEGPFTVFAPTDDAFAALPAGVLEGLLNDIPALTNILLYHVAAGETDAAELAQLETITTVQGASVIVEVTPDGIVLNDSVNIIVTDIQASNGIIHVIDAVLIPPQPPIP